MPADRAFFEEHGWIVVRKAVTPYQLAQLQVAFEEYLPLRGETLPGTILQTLDVVRYDDVFRRWMKTCAGPLVAEVLGCVGVRLLQDTITLKPARTGGRIEWHQDWSYMAYLAGARAAAVRLAVSEETVENGCMHVVDGSGITFLGPWWSTCCGRTQPRRSSTRCPPEKRAAGRIRPLELEPGDVSVHHTLTFHGSFENTSDRPRKTLIVHTFDASSKLDRTHVPSREAIRFPTDADGQLVGVLYPPLV